MGTAWWYRISSGTDFDDSEIANPVLNDRDFDEFMPHGKSDQFGTCAVLKVRPFLLAARRPGLVYAWVVAHACNGKQVFA